MNKYSGMKLSETLIDSALKIIIDSKKASASLLQRRMRIGYAQAASLIDLFELSEVIEPLNRLPRKVYVTDYVKAKKMAHDKYEESL